MTKLEMLKYLRSLIDEAIEKQEKEACNCDCEAYNPNCPCICHE